MAVKDMGASVLARLKKQAKNTGINYQMCLQLFAQEEFLRKLENSQYTENFVLKGGMFLYTISHYEGRPTMDIDFLLRKMSSSIGEIEAVIVQICNIYTGNNFIDMEPVGTRQITLENKYPGISVSIIARIKNVKIPFSVDIGVDDVIIPGAVKRIVTTRLEGFKEPEIYTYPLESTMAEKFDAILKRMTSTSRMKDFYDIFYWSQMVAFDGRTLQEAIIETLQHRGTSYERNSIEKIKEFEQNMFLQNMWKNYKPGQQLEKPEFACVLARICTFIGPVFDAILNEDEFFLKWNPAENTWAK